MTKGKGERPGGKREGREACEELEEGATGGESAGKDAREGVYERRVRRKERGSSKGREGEVVKGSERKGGRVVVRARRSACETERARDR